ncbi:hypothetical protein PNEG_01631 [Pneumocystis murina B123]|uniref:DNA-directed RNA polymerase III subunit RPC4 n=1 Tax=Pneumocystis murina (strain B123) TaxID=1069680 RepID=M7PIV9_PNEMU|nr:hypothetical protein PNEG_01631 [Pneumocystis murina B123]EMR10379.1 hypothetical protein PNEG_01631 [Pneumocystis murina B123]
MNDCDPDAPCEGRLGSIMLNKWDYMAKKDTKMKFIPKFVSKRENEGGKDLSDIDIKKEELPLFNQSEEGKMMLDVKQVENEMVEIKEEESKNDIYECLSLTGYSVSAIGSQEEKNIIREELYLGQEKEFFESDDEGVFKLNMEKLNILTNNGLNNMMLPVSSFYMDYKESFVNLEGRDSDKLLKEKNKIEAQLVLNDKSNEADFKAIENDSLTFEIQESVSKSTSSHFLNKKTKKKYNRALSVEEEQEREKVLDDFKIFTRYFIDKLAGDMKNSDELLFFQFPPILPALLKTEDTKVEVPKIKIENNDIMNVDSEQNIPHKTILLDHTVLHGDELSGMSSLPDSQEFDTFKQYLPDGCVGQLKIRKSGKTTILWGGIEMNVSLGSNCRFLQDIVALDYKNNKKAWLMGKIKQKFIVTPDIEQLLE